MYYPKLLPSIHLTEISQTDCFFASKIVLNGIILSLELWLPNFEDEKNKKINEIVDIVILKLDDITTFFVVCKTFTVAYEEHYECYRVKMESIQNEISIISVSEFLSQHYYPVKLHKIGSNYFFRCKRF